MRLSILTLSACALLSTAAQAQVPSITSFTPTAGIVNTAVVLSGSNFNTTVANNIVYFGATRATVTSSSATSLTVRVPAGATFSTISVLNTASHLTGYSRRAFNITSASSPLTVSSFQTRVDFPTSFYPTSVATGDLDGDGKADLAVASSYGTTVSVLRNTSVAGSLSPASFAAKVDFTAGDGPYAITITDLDGDGKPDLAVTNNDGSSISVLRNTSVSGSISFAPKVDFATDRNSISIAVGDFDGDGKPDLAVANSYNGTISVLRNTSVLGSVSFAPKADISTGSSINALAIADVDGDSKADLVYSGGVTNISVLRNTSVSGSISFAVKVAFATSNNPKSIAIGDLDGDGKADLASANAGANTVSVLRNTSVSGSVSFAPKADFTTGSQPYSIAIGDLDGDGKADLGVANNGSLNASVLRNTSVSGTISFASKVDFNAGYFPESIAIGDLDGDNKADLAVVNRNNWSVSVLWNGAPLIVQPDLVNAIPGTQVVVPVRVRAFTNMVGLQFGFTFPSALTYMAIEQLNPSLGLASSNFGVTRASQGQVNFAWTQPNNTAVTLADNSILFAVRFTVATDASPGTTQAVTIPTFDLPVNLNPITAVNSTFTRKQCATLPGGVLVPQATLSGRVVTSTGIGVPGASVYVKSGPGIPDTVTSNATGAFNFYSLVATGNYVLGANKRNDVNSINGIDVLDIALTQRHILNTAPFGNAYKVIAADVDRSNSVTVADVALIRDQILQTRTRFPKSRMWIMINGSQTFANPNSPWPIDTLRSYTNLAPASAAQDFIACKLGDVDNSYDPSIARQGLTSSQSVTVLVGDGNAATTGQTVQLPVRLQGADAMGVQFTLKWPKQLARLASATPLTGGCVLGQPTDSTLTLLAVDPSGAAIRDGATLAQLAFTALGATGTSTAITITSDVTAALAYDTALNSMPLTTQPGTLTVGNATATVLTSPKAEFSLWPNPAQKSVYLLAAPGTQFAIYDQLGRIMCKGVSSQQTTRISLEAFTPGFYQVGSNGQFQRLVVE